MYEGVDQEDAAPEELHDHALVAVLWGEDPDLHCWVELLEPFITHPDEGQVGYEQPLHFSTFYSYFLDK